MRVYALLKDNRVESVAELTEDEYRSEMSHYSMIIDIQDLTPQPMIGWLLDGNKLVPPETLGTEAIISAVLTRAVAFGCQLKKEMSVKIGTRNMMLGKTEQQIAALMGTLTTVGLLLEGGALRTARSMIAGVKAQYPEYTAECNYAVYQINTIVGE